MFAPDIQAGLQTFRGRWIEGECYALIQEAPWQMDISVVYEILLPTRDEDWLMVHCAE